MPRKNVLRARSAALSFRPERAGCCKRRGESFFRRWGKVLQERSSIGRDGPLAPAVELPSRQARIMPAGSGENDFLTLFSKRNRSREKSVMKTRESCALFSTGAKVAAWRTTSAFLSPSCRVPAGTFFSRANEGRGLPRRQHVSFSSRQYGDKGLCF